MSGLHISMRVGRWVGHVGGGRIRIQKRTWGVSFSPGSAHDPKGPTAHS